MRRSLLEFLKNYVANVLAVAMQMRIPKPKGFDAARLQKFLTLNITTLLFRKTVLASVQLDIQFSFFAEKIQVIITERMLTAEFVAIETPITQPAPQEFLRRSFLFAKVTSQLYIGHD